MLYIIDIETKEFLGSIDGSTYYTTRNPYEALSFSSPKDVHAYIKDHKELTGQYRILDSSLN